MRVSRFNPRGKFSSRVVLMIATLGVLGCLSACMQDAVSGTSMVADVRISAEELRLEGVFGFPQRRAVILADTPDLRVSVTNDAKHLFVQAVVWGDGDSALGLTPDGKPIGDNSSLMLDLDGDGKITPKLDRHYSLNPWPTSPGLRFQIHVSANALTVLRDDTDGRGAIRFVRTPEGRRIRVDTFAIPLAEISRKVGDRIRLCYYGHSAVPAFRVNSAGYGAPRQTYYSGHIPFSRFHEYVLAPGGDVAVGRVPDGQRDPVVVTTR